MNTTTLSVPTWWSTGPEPGNLGDVLTPVLLHHFGYEPVWTDRDRANLLCVGSIARFAKPGQTVLGSGIMWAHDRLEPRARYLAVRGPLTRDAVLAAGGECPEVYGDPALLLPLIFHPPGVPREHDIGIVPHYIDFSHIQRDHAGLRLIHPLRTDPLHVVWEIMQCRAIVSSSLHGIIVAHAYRIPAAWVRFGDRLDGDDVKFRDYAESMGIELVPYRSVREAVPVLPPLEAYSRRRPLLEAFFSLRHILQEAA